jgi:hypothetical protein
MRPGNKSTIQTVSIVNLAALLLSAPGSLALAAVPLPPQTASLNSVQSAPATPCSAPANDPRQTYDSIQGVWDAIYNIEDLSQQAALEGVNAPPRADWLQYYGNTLGQLIGTLEQDLAQVALSDDSRARLSEPISRLQSTMQDLKQQLQKLQTAIQGDPQKNDFRGPAKAILADAQTMDKALVAIYAKVGTQVSSAATSGAALPAGSITAAQPSSTLLQGSAQTLAPQIGVQQISKAADKIHDASMDLISELERWNLLWGQPPQSGIKSEFYGGGFTPQEIESQYRYLPEVAFTMPGYVQRFSYRLPPRQKYLVMYTTQLGQLLNLMTKEIDDIKFTPEQAQTAAPQWSRIIALRDDAATQYLQLLQMVNKVTDKDLKSNIREDQLNFGKPTVAIYDDMQKLKPVLSDLTQIVGR